MDAEAGARSHGGPVKFCRMGGLWVAVPVLVCGLGARLSAGPPNATPAAFRDGVVLMSFHRNISPAGQELVLSDAGVTELKRIGVDVHVLKVPSGHVMDVIQRLKGRSEVRYAEPDFIAT